MSRSRRIGESADVVDPYQWTGDPAGSVQQLEPMRGLPATAGPGVPMGQELQLAALEREAFTKGFEQGEKAGLQASSAHAESMLQRLAGALEELVSLRKSIIRQTERQMIELALAMAKRIVRREIALDEEFALALARVALDRLGDSIEATIRLHPDDHAIAVSRDLAESRNSHVSIVADGAVARGGCVVESDLGVIDASVEMQFEEIAGAVLPDVASEATLSAHDG